MLRKIFSYANLQECLKPLRNAVDGEAVDLTVKIDSGSRKLSWLDDAVNRLIAKFHGAIVKSASTSVHIAQIAPQLAALSQSLKDQAHQQQMHSDDIAAAGVQIADTVESIAASADAASTFSQQVAAAARSAHKNGAEAGEQINAIGDAVQNLGERLEQLNSESRVIGEIVQLIKNIAEQTKLLSLNAAIEAARAGEHGRGFGVVADEVRKLAYETTNATQNVETALAGIQGSVAQAVDTMNTVRRQVEAGADITSASSKSLHQANDDITVLIEHVHRIAEAGTMQKEGARQVADQIKGVAGSAHQQLAGAVELATLTETMRNNCEDLLMSIGVFRFDRHRDVKVMIEGAAAALKLESPNAPYVENRLVELVNGNACLELLYVTDNHGRQVSSNVSPAGCDRGVIGRNWSERPWFKQAVAKRSTYVSNIYRSVATGIFCFTVSTPLRNKAGEIVGVLAADVRFDQILDLN
jgi:methyl-accepting chemotaxis protein